MKYVLTEDIYVDKTQTRVVPGTSQEAAFVVGGKGSEIDLDWAIRLGLTTPVEQVVAEAADTVQREPTRYDEPMYRRPTMATGSTVAEFDPPVAAITVASAALVGDDADDDFDDDDADDDKDADEIVSVETERHASRSRRGRR